MFTHMRIARPVSQLERSVLMFSQGLGLQKIAESTGTSNSPAARDIPFNPRQPKTISSSSIIRMKMHGSWHVQP